MEDHKNLADVKGKNKKTVVKTEGKTVATQGGGKQTTQTVLTNNQQKKVNEKAKIVAKGKELPKAEVKRESKVVASAPKTEVKMETPKKNIKVDSGKIQTEIKKDAKKLGKAGKVGLGIAGAAAVSAGLVAAKKMKDKKDDAKKADVKEFSEKESKAEKVAKAATIGGSTVGLGAGLAALGTEIGRKKVKKSIEEKTKEMYNTGGGIKAKKAAGEAIDKLKKNEKILEKVSKHAPKAVLAGVGTSLAGAAAYKALKKKNDQKEFSEKKEDDDKKENKKNLKVR
jgi:hypothetical protein